MSNGFYFVPQNFYERLEQQAQGDITGALKKIVEDFLKRSDINDILTAYQEPEPYNPKAMSGDDFDYPTFWRHVDKAGLDSSTRASRDKVMSAALAHHFGAVAKPAPDQLTTLHVHIEQGLYAALRERALATGTPQAELITGCIERYLAAPAAFEPPVSYKVGDVITVFHYHASPAVVEALTAALPGHPPTALRPKTELRDIAAIAVAADFKRAADAVTAARSAAAKRARMGVNTKYKIKG